MGALGTSQPCLLSSLPDPTRAQSSGAASQCPAPSDLENSEMNQQVSSWVVKPC